MSLGRSDPPGSSISTPRGHECESRVSRRELGRSHERHLARLPAAPPTLAGNEQSGWGWDPKRSCAGSPRQHAPGQATCCLLGPADTAAHGTDSATALLQGVGRMGWWAEGLAGKRAVSLALREKQALGRWRRERRQWGGGARR